MNISIRTALVNQANHELFAAQSYLAMAMWCENSDYNGFAAFFYKQSREEQEHAARFLKHMLDRGELPELSPMEAPKGTFSSLREVAEYAQTLEGRNTANINQCYEIALEVNDFTSQPMLMEFITEQIEEDSWASSMVSMVSRSECPGALFNLDRHIIKELDGDPMEAL